MEHMTFDRTCLQIGIVFGCGLKKKCYVSNFPTDWSKSAPTATFLALRKKKKKKSRRPTLFNDSGFYQKSKPFRYENLSAPIFGYFRSLTLRSRTTTWLLCSVLTRPSTLVAIYFDKCSHIPASNVIKALRHNVPLSLLYEDGHPRCKGFRFGVTCAVRRKSGQKKTKKKTYQSQFSKEKKKKKKKKKAYLPTLC